MVHYLRSVCRDRFFAKNKTLLDIKPQHLILTRPRDLFYEIFVFGYYKNIVEFVKKAIELKSSLEEDLRLLKEGVLTWHQRMAIVYRSERKKIIRNQIKLAEKILADLEATVRYIGEAAKEIQSDHFQTIILKRCDWEQKEFDEIEGSERQDKSERLE
jgi:hypothetical protein